MLLKARELVRESLRHSGAHSRSYVLHYANVIGLDLECLTLVVDRKKKKKEKLGAIESRFVETSLTVQAAKRENRLFPFHITNYDTLHVRQGLTSGSLILNLVGIAFFDPLSSLTYHYYVYSSELHQFTRRNSAFCGRGKSPADSAVAFHILRNQA